MTKLSEKTGGGLIYAPPMMEFDGASYYGKALTTTGNNVTVTARFKISAFTGNSSAYLVHVEGVSNYIRAVVSVYSSDYSGDTSRQNKMTFLCRSSTNTNLCLLLSDIDVCDGAEHVLFASFNATTGEAAFYIDGVSVDNTGWGSRALTTGTLESGAGDIGVGAAAVTGLLPITGQMGYVGYKDAYLTNWQDFMDSQGNPKALDQFGWTQWGGGVFAPTANDFNGSTGYFSLAAADHDLTSGLTVVARFKWEGGTITSAGGFNRTVGIIYDESTNIKCALLVVNDETGDARAGRVSLFVQDNSGTTICTVYSNTVVSDGTWHTVLAAYDPAGTATLIVDGASDINTGASGHTVSAGTPAAGSGAAYFGARGNIPDRYFDGQIGFLGVGAGALTNWSDFMLSDGTPREIDELNWTEWGGQPLFWHKYGVMNFNKGSAGNMTKNGTVTFTPHSQPAFWHPAGKMDEGVGSNGAMTKNGTITLSDAGSQGLPMIGRPTVGTAIAADIRSGKTAWVDGLEVVGDAYYPAMMQFDGASYYSKAVTPSTNKITFVFRFKIASRAGTGQRFLAQITTAAGVRGQVMIGDAGHTYMGDKIRFAAQDSGGTLVCRVHSASAVADNTWHTLLVAYDGDAGTAVLYLDGASDLDSGNGEHTLTTGTMDTAAGNCTFGSSVAASNFFTGQMGFAGLAWDYLTNWQDFMDAQGNPKPLDEFGWTQWGGGTFAPASQDFDGSTGYFSKASITVSGNKVTAVLRFKRPAYTANSTQTMLRIADPINNNQRINIGVIGTGYLADPNIADTLYASTKNSSNVVICQLLTTTNLCDGSWHTVMYSFDADAGTAQLIVDGADADDTGNASRVAPTTGTLDTTAIDAAVGASGVSGSGLFDGEIGFVGARDAYLTNWGDFMDATGVPQEIDELNWTEWGGQPLFWNKYGAMDDNKGSAGNMTRNGTVTHTPNSQPLFWHEAAKMDEQLGSAGVMTENGTILLGKGGN